MQNPERHHSILSEPYAVDLILYIGSQEEIMAYQLRAVHSNYVKMFALAERLSEAGVISMKKQKSPRVIYTFALTAKGRRLAAKLDDARKILGE